MVEGQELIGQFVRAVTLRVEVRTVLGTPCVLLHDQVTGAGMFDHEKLTLLLTGRNEVTVTMASRKDPLGIVNVLVSTVTEYNG